MRFPNLLFLGLCVFMPAIVFSQANNDAVTTDEDVATTIDVLFNDSDIDGIDITSVDLDPGTAGRQTSTTTQKADFTVDNAGIVTITPKPNENGNTSVSYSVLDLNGDPVGEAELEVTITPVNDAPVAVSDAKSTLENTATALNILVNDSDLEGNIDNSTIDLDPDTPGQQTSLNIPQGVFTLTSSTLHFTPATGFDGVVVITYTVKDDDGGISNAATVTITVTNVNVAPIAVNDATSTNENTQVSINVLSNDSDDVSLNTASVDLDPITVGQQTSLVTAQGNYSVSAGIVTFTPATNVVGVASISYTVLDNEGAVSNVASLTITVNNVNVAPIAVNDATSTNENTQVSINVLSNDSDDVSLNTASVDLDPITGGQQTSLVTAQGNYSVSAGIVTFTPATNVVGVASISYTVLDNEGAVSNVATLTITVNNVNVAPIAVNDATSTNENTQVSINVLSNDSDDVSLNTASVDLDPITGGQQTSLVTAQGNYSVSAGIVTFTPATNVVGVASISYTVLDNEGAVSNVATLTITVNNVNVAPVAGNDNATTNENTPVSINVLLNDNDPDGTLNTGSVDLDPGSPGQQTTRTTAQGNYSVFSGTVTFTPATNYSGPASITYTVLDNEGLVSNAATISITVNNVNVAPVAGNDNATTNENTPVSINVLLNDNDPDGTLNTGSVDLDPGSPGQQTTRTTAQGNYSVFSGTVTFTPATNYSGPASITYTVLDNEGLVSNAATLTITVNNVNVAPVAGNDNATTNENTPVSINVLSNDNDPDGTLNTGSVDLDPGTPGQQTTRTTAQGNYSVSSGTVTFTPATNYSGPASITYTVLDNEGLVSNAATVSITVNNVNVAPVAGNDNATTNENTPVSINVLSNDNDPDGTLNTGSVDLDPGAPGQQTTRTTAQGNYSVSSGTVTFTPATNYSGPASITYTVLDNEGLVSNAATITITVNNVNVAPVAGNDNATTNENTPVSINVLSNDNDPDGTLNTGSVDLDPGTPGQQTTRTTAQGNYSVSSGTVTFTPATNYSGPASITYTVLDNEGLVSNAATITITVNNVNVAPVAGNDNATTNENIPVTFNIISNDSDTDGTLNTASVDLDPTTPGQQTTRTTVQGNYSYAAGSLTFTPTTGFSGLASITYTISDNEGLASNAATISITVNNVNLAPVAVNDVASGNENTPITLNIVSNDSDSDGTINAASVDLDITTPGQQTTLVTPNGTYTVNATGVLTFTPATSFIGVATISYNVKDNEGLVSNNATISLTVNNVNDAPVAANDNAATTEDQTVTVNILLNDTDDGSLNPSTVDLNSSVAGFQSTLTTAQGTFSVTAAGLLEYIPQLNSSGIASVSYTVNDNEGLTSNVATVTITVSAVNDAPIVVSDDATINEDTQATINIVANDSDPDGTIDPTTVDLDINTAGIQQTRTTSNGVYVVNASGVVTFTPVANFNGTATIQYTVKDNEGLTSSPTTISITVIPVNDLPVANDDTAITDEGVAITINILQNDTDDSGINPSTVDLNLSVPGVQNSVTITGGTLIVSSSGVVTYSPSVNFNGIVTHSYTVQDNSGSTSNQGTITITVNSVNTNPVAANDAATTNEDVAVTLNVIGNDTDDISINPATVDLNVSIAGIQNTRTVPEGTFTVSTTGVVTFTPIANFFGNVNIRYTVNDNENATSNMANISITVISVNDKPVAQNDSRTTNEDTPATVNVIANDSDVDGTINTSSVDLNLVMAGIQNSVTTAEGIFTADASGIVTFVSVVNFFGTASVAYTVSDNDGLVSDPATLTITVISINDAPIAANDIATTNQGQTVTFNIITNDLDVDGSIISNTVDLVPGGARQTTRSVAGGNFSVDDSGNVTFVPIPSFSGNSSITYTVNDNAGAISNVATISVLVNYVNVIPVANPDVATTNEDTPVAISVLANDTDDGTLNAATVDLNLTIGGIQNTITVTSGTFSVNGSGVVTFTPVANFHGTASIDYTVNDNIGESSLPAKITVTILPVNDAPVANNDAVTTNEDTEVIFNPISNDTDVDGTINPATVDLNPSTEEIDLTRTLTQGIFSVNTSTGAVTYTPSTNYNGPVTLPYNVRDNSGAKSNTATINITVSNVNDPPVFDVIADQRVLKNAAQKVLTLTGISAGPSENELVLLTASSGNTSLIPDPVIAYSGSGTTASLTFKPQLNQSGVATITVKAVDGGLNELVRTFQITVVDVRIITDPVLLAVEGEIYEYNIEINELPETLTLSTAQKPAWATLVSTGKNKARLSGVPPVNSTNTTIRIQVKDGAIVLDEQQYNLIVNRRPSASPFSFETNEDVSVLLPLSKFTDSYSDPNGHPLSEIQITQLPRHGSLLMGSVEVSVDQVFPVSALSGFTYRPQKDYVGLDTVYYKPGDGYHFSANSSYFHFVISPVNDPPEITVLETEPMSFDIGRELAQIFTTTFDAVDADGDEITRAEIGFRRPNFNSLHDVLEFTNTGKITGSYDVNAGILTLNGKASVEEYRNAIRSISYNYIDLDDIVLDQRTVYIVLNDGQSSSEPKERIIKLVYDFVELKIPTVFTPDGNNSNEDWVIYSENGLQQYNDTEIRVFDKMGRMVFETIGFDKTWDGTLDGKPLPAETYFYTIDLNYGKITYQGTVTILRQPK